MKLKKAEKIWLISVLVLFFLYNLPFVPGYNNPVGTLIHAVLTLVPLWVIVYAGLFHVSGKSDQEDQES